MYNAKYTSIGLPQVPSANGSGDLLYDEDEIEMLREELIETFSTEREKMITRDQITEIKRTELAMKEHDITMARKTKEDEIMEELKAKQEALKMLYETVLLENIEFDADGKKKIIHHHRHQSKHPHHHHGHPTKPRRSSSSESAGSFHKMYTVYRDPTNVRKTVDERKKKAEAEEPLEEKEPEVKKTEFEPVVVPHSDPPPGKPFWEKYPLPPIENLRPKKPSVDDEPKVTKQRSKFVLKKDPPKSKPPPLLPGEVEVHKRKDVRYSKDHNRYSFDVDVAGPFYTTIDPKKRKPRMRNVGTQVMLMESVGQNMPPLEEEGSQTEFEVFEDDGRSFSSGRSRSRGSSYNTDNEMQEGGGDASSSSHTPSEKGEGDDGGDDDKGKRASGSQKRPSGGGKSGKSESGKSLKSLKSGTRSKSIKSGASKKDGKTLERKESKRRDAETMARPRGYRDLNLKGQPAYVTFEAETSVTSHDLEKELAKRRGQTLPKDNILWPTCEEFDIETAVKKIEDYIKNCWKIDSKWLWVTQPIEVYHDNYRKKFVYEVKFSIPSPTTPVPPATASVFFVFEIPLYSARDDTVQVSYVLEGNRFAHQPGKIPFQDKWLQGIIADKIRIQKLTNF